MRQLAIVLIRIYQCTLSPLFGNCCRFQPSCSNYAIDALRTHGFFKGSFLSFIRICKCHPFHPGGYDPVPPRMKSKPQEDFIHG